MRNCFARACAAHLVTDRSENDEKKLFCEQMFNASGANALKLRTFPPLVCPEGPLGGVVSAGLMNISTNGGGLEQLQPRFQPQPLSKAAEEENPASLESRTNSGRPLCHPENLRCHGNQQHHCVQYNGGPCAGVSMGTRAPG